MLFFLSYLATLYFIPMVSSVEWIEHRGLWYYISENEMVDYTDATQICDTKNSHLAVITNKDQNDFLKNESSNNSERWIGLSTLSSYHNDSQCSDNIWFWNSDWNCTNSFEPTGNDIYATLPVSYIPTECAGVTTFAGMWTMQDCSLKFGYICQWECKRFYLNLRNYDNDKLNGIYNIDTYYRGNAIYIKADTNRRVRIYKSENNKWILNDNNESNTQRARFETDSYVPYGNELFWKSVYGAPIDSSSWCVECEELFMCIPRTPSGISNCDFMRLNSTIPNYSNLNGTVFIKHIHNSDSCICSPTKDNCGQRCGYIFPYPNVITSIRLNGETVVFNNMCILQKQSLTTTYRDSFERSSIGLGYNTANSNEFIPTNKPVKEISTSDINAQNVRPDLEDEMQSVKLITIAASVVSVVMVIIIIVVVVTFVLIRRRRRNRNKDTASDLQTNVHVTSSSNGYMGFDSRVTDNASSSVYTELQTNASPGNVYMGFDSRETDNASSCVYTELQTNASPSNAYMGFDSGVTDNASSSVYTELQTNAGSL